MTEPIEPTARPPAAPIADEAPASSALADLAQRVWDGHMAAHPVYATALGDRRFDDRLRANGPGAIEDDVRRLSSALDEARAIDATGLSAADRITHGALLDFLGHELDRLAGGLDAWNVDPLDGPQVAYLNVPSFQPVRTVQEGDALVTRWREIGPWIDRLVGTTRDAMVDGIAAPQAQIRSVVAELDDLLATPTDSWPLMDPARAAHDDWPVAAGARHQAAVRDAVEAGIRPAFERYRAFLVDELMPRARGD